jgi:phenylalanyl-tRNA synthetase beta chain
MKPEIEISSSLDGNMFNRLDMKDPQVVEAYPNIQEQISIKLRDEVANNILGTQYSSDEIENILRATGFNTERTAAEELLISVPWWRADIHIAEDVVEEIGRLYGFDNIKPTLPQRDFSPVGPSEYDSFKSRVRQILVRSGANEALTYSFVHGDVIRKANQDPDNSYRIVNSLSPDLQYYRQTLLPSLIGLVYPNIKQGFDKFAIFEINKTHDKSAGLNKENVPVESDNIGLTTAGKSLSQGAPYYLAKKFVDYLADSLGVKVTYETLLEHSDPIDAPFEPKRAARVVDKSGKVLGVVGEYNRSVKKNFKLPEFTSGFELNAEQLYAAAKNGTNKYSQISRYPFTERDICFKVEKTVNYGQIIDSATRQLSSFGLESGIIPVDIYQPVNESTKNITIRLKLTAHDHTLTGEEVAGVIKAVSDSVVSETGATVI